VVADARRVSQVLSNLLSNAVKFTPPGGAIRVGARCDAEFTEFWVTDTGVGIAPDQLVRVFERFYKTDPSRAGSGTGLGLAICKHLVRAHGGAIWAESQGPGRGATFRFTLPAVRFHRDQPVQTPSSMEMVQGAETRPTSFTMPGGVAGPRVGRSTPANDYTVRNTH